MKRVRTSAPIRSITEFAPYLGFSVGTVSRPINGSPVVKEKTRRLILAAMKEVGYEPSPAARALVGARSGMVGVCSIGLSNPILNTRIIHLQDFLREHDLRFVLEMGYQNPGHERRVIEDFQSHPPRWHCDDVLDPSVGDGGGTSAWHTVRSGGRASRGDKGEIFPPN